MSKWKIKCINCSFESNLDTDLLRCPLCNDLLELEPDELPSIKSLYRKDKPGIWRFSSLLPVQRKIVSLNEGNTPLIQGNGLDNKDLFFKLEGSNPTGSFKDRGMTVAVSRAVSLGKRILVCASTGNTSSSLSAYAAKSGLKSVVLVPSGSVSSVKLAQAYSYGAKIYSIEGNFDRVLEIAVKISEKYNLYLVNSINPYRIEGQKTVSFEIYEQLKNTMPSYVFIPVGNAGNISAVFKGFSELARITNKKIPSLIGVQAEGAAPLVQAFSRGEKMISRVEKPETVASAIRIGNPVSWKKAMRAVKETNGMFISVSDSEIKEAREELAKKQGVLVEYASAASYAGFKKLASRIPSDSKVVCILTGSGLKEKLASPRIRPIRPEQLEDSIVNVYRALGLRN